MQEPLSTDVIAVRQTALAEAKPCAIIANIDAATLHERVARVYDNLLNSQELKALGKSVRIALVRADDAAMKALRDEFGIHVGNTWVIILDSRGEIIANFILSAFDRCNKEEMADLGKTLAEQIEQGLKITSSIQDLERNWASKQDYNALEALVLRLNSTLLIPRMVKLCDGIKNNRALPREVTNLAAIYTYIGYAQSGMFNLSLSFSQFMMREGEKLIVHLPDHKYLSIAATYLISHIRNEYDTGKVFNGLLHRLAEHANKVKNPAPLRKIIESIEQGNAGYLAHLRKQSESADELTADYYKMQLAVYFGDAQKVIQLMAKRTEFNHHPVWKMWLEAALASTGNGGDANQTPQAPAPQPPPATPTEQDGR